MKKQIALALALVPMTGCGMLQSYNQGLDNNQRTFERQQAVLDAQNQVQIAKLNVQAAEQQAQLNIAIATGKAKAQEIQTASLRPLFVQQELVDAIAAGKVNTLVLPASAMLPLNLQGAVQAQGEDQK
jgi:hypothetical protein